MCRVQSWTSAAINQNITQVSPTSHLLSAWLCSKFVFRFAIVHLNFRPAYIAWLLCLWEVWAAQGTDAPYCADYSWYIKAITNTSINIKHRYKYKHKQEYKPEYTHKYKCSTWPADAPPAISARQLWLQIQIQLQTQTQMWFWKSQLVNSVFIVVPYQTGQDSSSSWW